MNISKAFLEAVQQPDEQIDLTYCALLISQAIQPGLDITPYREQLELLTAEAQVAQIATPTELLSFLVGKHRFSGDTETYSTVENSLLDKVLTKHSGIPISLGLIYIHVGKALPLSVYGINFPGRFLVGVKSPTSQNRVLIDPFTTSIVSPDQAYQLLQDIYQQPVTPQEHHFEPADNKAILLRLLENIKANYLQQGNAHQALTSLDFQLMIAPDEALFLKQQQELLALVNKSEGASGLH